MSDILVVDDEADIRTLIGDILSDEGHGVRLAWDSETALTEINRAAPDLIVLDIWLKDSRLDGIDILKKVKRDNPAIPVVIISGHGNIEIAVAAIKQGAYDFIEKPFNIDQLMVVIGRALEASRLRRENAALKTRDNGSSVMLGGSPNFRHMKSQLDKVARTNSRVMLSGPAGAGKEVAARYIHKNSERARGPFVTVNSATIGADQMEDVLFGRESPERGVEPGSSSGRTPGSCSSTRWPTCRSAPSRRSCACSSTRASSGSAAPTWCASTCASSPPAPAISPARCRRAASAPSSTTG